MNIKQAKEEIQNTLRAYLAKDEWGNYRIPAVRQRPVLLMGPPGIGKTQIMEQIAGEMNVGLVAYTITHHTRQSAIGLPFIEKRIYGGEERTVTEYTMSEILSSVYEKMEKSGIREGILFLDEINCVSETLAPMMLQFLQCKTFGNQALPEGWLIVAAGNPPEYNKSVRDFDVVTLDRVKRMDVKEDFAVWKEYALQRGLHGAVISYLDIKKDNFYRIETSVDGLQFATARGWEDLSEIICTYEELGLQVDREVIGQYIQLPRIAKDFANYLELYNKYRKTYRVEEILAGRADKVTELQLRDAPFDEKLSVMGLLLSRLAESSRRVRHADTLTAALHGDLLAVKAQAENSGAAEALASLIGTKQKELLRRREAGQLNAESRNALQAELARLESFSALLRDNSSEDGMELLRGAFSEDIASRRQWGEETARLFDNAFRFLEHSVGESQELVLFVTEITATPDTSWFVENFGCDAYFRYNKSLLFDDTRRRLEERILRANEGISE